MVLLSSNELLQLDGQNEPVSDTIRKFIASHLTIPDVAYISEGGVDAGGRVVTGVTAAYVDVISKTGTNQFRLTWIEVGEARNSWDFFVRGGASARIDIRNVQSQIRVTWPDSSNFKLFYDFIRLNSDITSLFTVSELQGDSTDAESDKARQETISFEGGVDDVVDRETELTAGDMSYFEKDQAVFVKVYDGDITSLESAPALNFYQQTVHIDIFGNRAHVNNTPQMIAVRDQIDAIILGNIRGPFEKSATSGNSAILGFKNFGLDWVRVSETLDEGVSESLHGELFVFMQRSVSSSD